MKMLQCLADSLNPVPTDVCFCNDTLYVSTADAKVMAWNNFRASFNLVDKAATSSPAKVSKKPTDAPQSDQLEETDDDGRPRKLLKPSRSADDDEEIDFTEATKPAPPLEFVDEEASDDADPIAGDMDDNSVQVGNDDGSTVANSEDLGASRPRVSLPTVHIPDPQPPFAPSATPLDLSRRFLCWNYMGTITTMQLDGRNSVSIQFHDAGFRVKSNVNFTDTMGFILGSLGKEGGLFATDLPEDDEEDDDELRGVVDGLQISEQTKVALKKSTKGNKAVGSTIYFHRFETFSSVRDKGKC